MLMRTDKFEMAEGLTPSILDRLGVPIFVVEKDSNLRYANAAGAEMLSRGGPLRAVNNALCTDHMPDNQRLRLAIANTCIDGESQAMMMTDERQKHPPIAMIVPFGDGTDQALVVLRCMAEMGDASTALVQSLRQLFKLSPAEAQIAMALARGADLHEIAKERGVKLNTLRSQIAAIMAKTGTRRQAELVALIARLESPI